MIFGTLAVLILSWLVWDYSATLTEQRVRYDESTRRYAEQAVNRIEERCGFGLTPTALRGCIFREVESAEDQKRSERDLDAQESVARSTRAMMLTAFVGLFAGIASVGLIWATLLETRRMAGDAREIGYMQNRPWLVSGLDIPGGLLSSKDSLPFVMKLGITNIGNSTAMNMLADVFLFQNFDHNDEAKLENLRDSLINRNETKHERPGSVFPKETFYKDRAESLLIDKSLLIPFLGGVFPVACVISVYKIPTDKEWHCTATIFDIFIRDRNKGALGDPFPVDGKSLSGDNLKLVMRRHAIGT